MKISMSLPSVAVLLLTITCPLPLHALGVFFTSGTETVMPPGMEIEATNRFGRIVVRAGEGTARTYIWEGGRETVNLYRRKGRWYGSRGLYHPGGGRCVHLVVEEGQQHFCSEKEAQEWWLRDQNSLDLRFAANGIVVGWSRAKHPDMEYWAVCVRVWQVVINGKRAALPPPSGGWGAWVLYPGEQPLPEVNASFVPSQPRVINGRLFSGKVLDLMAERGVRPEEVENTISRGKVADLPAPFPDGWRLYILPGWRPRAETITVDADGRVANIVF